MPNHTPGPWSLEWDGDFDENNNYGEWVIAVLGPDGKEIVGTEFEGDNQDDNARLIAAAPVMYAVMKRILDPKVWREISRRKSRTGATMYECKFCSVASVDPDKIEHGDPREIGMAACPVLLAEEAIEQLQQEAKPE